MPVFPRTEVIFGTLDDFGRAITDLAPDLPVVRKDLADSWIHGTGSMPREVGILRAVRSRLVQAESALSLRSLCAGQGRGRRRSPSVGAERPSRPPTKRSFSSASTPGEWTRSSRSTRRSSAGGRTTRRSSRPSVTRENTPASSARGRTRRRSLPRRNGTLAAVESHLRARDSAGGVLEVANHHVWEYSGPVRIGPSDRDVRVVPRRRCRGNPRAPN